METKEEEATGAKVTVRFTGLDLEDAAGFVDVEDASALRTLFPNLDRTSMDWA